MTNLPDDRAERNAGGTVTKEIRPLARRLARAFLADLARHPGFGLTADPAAGGKLRVVPFPRAGIWDGPNVGGIADSVFRFDSPGIRGDVTRFCDRTGQPLTRRLLAGVIRWLELEAWAAARDDHDRRRPLVLTGDPVRPIAPAAAAKGGDQ